MTSPDAPSADRPGVRPAALATAADVVGTLVAFVLGSVAGLVATVLAIVFAMPPMQFGQQVDHPTTAGDVVVSCLICAVPPVGVLVVGRALQRVGVTVVGLLAGVVVVGLGCLAVLPGTLLA